MIGNRGIQKIRFHYLANPFQFRQRKLLKQKIIQLFEAEQKHFESVTYIFCSDEYLLAINTKFLQHDYYTDIITFNLAGKNSPALGEVYVSVERVADNAKQLRE